VTRLKKGDRVVVPFTISCGQCFFCNKALFAACETTNPGRGAILNKKNVRSGAGLFGYSHLYGGYPGGQAEFVRVPKANVGPLIHGFLFGDAFEKGLTFKMGQTHAQQRPSCSSTSRPAI
jgi:threonine dehydrogenase-like Zn-dependent dehydrogenase